MEWGPVGTRAGEGPGQVFAHSLSPAGRPVQTLIDVVAVDERVSGESGLARAGKSSRRVAADGVGSALSTGAQGGVTFVDI